MNQNRRSRRSNVLLSASIEFAGTALPVKLRNLSSEGALIEAEKLPVEGSQVVFRKAELSLAGRIAWVERNRAGLAFAAPLAQEAVLRHIPAPKPRVKPDFRRPGLGRQTLSEGELRFGETFIWRSPITAD